MPFLPPLADADGEGFLFPGQASTFAENSDSLFWLITWISVVFFVLVVGAMGWFMWRYRHKPAETFSPDAPNHNLPLELSWTIIPTLLVIVIFGFGFTGYLDQRTPPADAYEVRVIAKKWNFQFVYPDAGFTDPKLYIPVGRPVRLRMVSQDVLHSFWVPAFRAKWDIVPGRDSIVWFECTEPGEYLFECTEYCGRGHSSMIGEDGVVALPLEEFEAGLREAKLKAQVGTLLNPVEEGEQLYVDAGCKACHSVDESIKLNCPTWDGLWGAERQFTDGTSAVADDAYLEQSIIQPDARIVQGYRNVMPSYKGQLTNIQLFGLTQYIRSLSEEGRAAAEKFDLEGRKRELAEEVGIDLEAAEAEAAAAE